jgi:hypothetical protein
MLLCTGSRLFQTHSASTRRFVLGSVCDWNHFLFGTHRDEGETISLSGLDCTLSSSRSITAVKLVIIACTPKNRDISTGARAVGSLREVRMQRLVVTHIVVHHSLQFFDRCLRVQGFFILIFHLQDSICDDYIDKLLQLIRCLVIKIQSGDFCRLEFTLGDSFFNGDYFREDI